jgi:hypothetical protein
LSPIEWVVGYPAALQAGPGVVGGKGWNLARLDHFGFSVPRGGVLIAEAHRHGLSDAVIGAVADFLSKTGLDSVPLAVRSSATAEDSPHSIVCWSARQRAERRRSRGNPGGDSHLLSLG